MIFEIETRVPVQHILTHTKGSVIWKQILKNCWFIKKRHRAPHACAGVSYNFSWPVLKWDYFFFCFKTLLYLRNTKRNRRDVQRREIVADNCLAQLHTDRPRVLSPLTREGQSVMSGGMTVEDSSHSTLYLPVDCGPRKDPWWNRKTRINKAISVSRLSAATITTPNLKYYLPFQVSQ